MDRDTTPDPTHGQPCSHTGSLPEQRRGARGFCAETVYRAVRELIAETGYERLTMDAVAARAQASKATLYRHWSGKPDLVAHAVKRGPEEAPRRPDTGSLRDDLRALLRGYRDRVASQDGEIFLGIIKAMQTDDELARAVRARHGRARADLIDHVLSRAAARGELDTEADAELLISAALSEMTSRHLMRGQQINDDFVDRLVDEVIIPGITRTR